MPGTLLTRFERQSSHWKKGKRIREGFFEPMWHEGRLETSVFDVSGLEEVDVWDLAVKHVEPSKSGPVRARADFEDSVATDLGLQVEAAVPPERHHVLVGWPTEKDKELLILAELAEQATLRLRP